MVTRSTLKVSLHDGVDDELLEMKKVDDDLTQSTTATAIFYKNQPTVPDYEQCLQVFGRPSGITREGLLKLLKSQKKQEAKL